MRILLLFFALVVGSMPLRANAGDVDMATIETLMLSRGYGERLFIALDESQNQPVSCHSNNTWQYVLDISDPIGEKFYSILLTAYAAGKEVNFIGSGGCSVYPSIETLKRVELQ